MRSPVNYSIRNMLKLTFNTPTLPLINQMFLDNHEVTATLSPAVNKLTLNMTNLTFEAP